MYKNLAAALRAASCATLAAACVHLPVLAQSPAARAASGALPSATSAAPAPGQAPPLQAAWLYVSPVTPAGWTRQHDSGRQAAERALGARVHTRAVADVPEGADAERVLRDLAAQGNQVIFTTSFGYMQPVQKVAADFPQVKFECLTCLQTAPNIATANARFYEGRYLAGIAAGRMTKGGSVGYVAGFPIPEVLQGLNAFTVGLRSVNPQAQVKVVWLGEWFNPPRERDAAMTLMNQGADVLAFHTGSTAVMAAAEERGQLAVAYHSDMRAVAPQAQLLAVTHHWGDYATRRLQAALDGRWRSATLWGGVKDGMVRVGDFGPRVPAAVQREVLARQQDIAAGRLHPFTGPLRDNQGRTVLAAGQRLGDEQILKMNWLAEGVQGTLPR
ncbi:BMP family ABC transporter substrate-binding protein [Comamonadaceae bacterium OH2545_COT-014]|nr:BMP family ABC transporter substrate-binding protein [Comamonadaceae bacterium OH2545_COT-014]